MKKVLILICVLMLSLTLVSCNSVEKYKLKSASAPSDISYKETNLEGVSEFMNKLDFFSAKLTVSLYKDSDKNTNICVSPISVYMALAMAIECASGQTKEEMLNAVGVTYEDVLKFTGYLYSLCNKEYTQESFT